MTKHQFLITLQVEQPDATEEEATRSLRQFLKAALRCYGIRCIAASPLPADRQESPVTHDKGTT